MKMQSYTWGPSYLDDAVRIRLWAPAAKSVLLRLDDKGDRPMQPAADGWYEITVPIPEDKTPYGFVVDGAFRADPASRGQLSDVHGPSVLHDPQRYLWQVSEWKGRPWEEAVFYETHIGAFTPEGTFRAAIEQLDKLAELGITVLEIMPVAHFPGKRGWGYDGVLLYAPHSAYGTPDDFKMLVDAAHARGIMVFLDVVYNHFGPEGNYLGQYAPDFFDRDRQTPWGAAVDYGNKPVRAYFVENVLYWLDEYRLDGLRLDAVDQIEDQDPHILEEIARAVHGAFTDRTVHLVTENPANGTDLLARRPDGVRLYRADWNDDFHHAVRVAATGQTGGFFEKYSQAPWQQVSTALAEGYLRHGKPILDPEPPPAASMPPTSYIHFLQNHDQIGNRALGDRLDKTLDPEAYRQWMAILLLSPHIPLIFMGEDYGEEHPFHFFADYEGEIAEAMRQSRPREAEHFGGIPDGFSVTDIRDPNHTLTFLRSKLDHRNAETAHGRVWRAYIKELLTLRREKIVPLLADAEGHAGKILPTGDRMIAVDWTLGQHVLSVRANMAAGERSLPPATGNRIFGPPIANTDGEDLTLPELSVCVFVD